MIAEVMLEESVVGCKGFGLEVMQDFRDNVVIICSIENVDAMGVHTANSITVAPAQTLTDREYQTMRDAGHRHRAGKTGWRPAGLQHPVRHPSPHRRDGGHRNKPPGLPVLGPRLKATGFPIAKIAAKLAVGYTLDEIHNDITRETYASFEPTIDYCVVKIPRFGLREIPGAEDFLTTAMKSVGEVMAIGRTFEEALQKGIRSLEIARFGLGADGKDLPDLAPDAFRAKLRVPNSQRLFYLRQAFRQGMSVDEAYELPISTPGFSTRFGTWWLFRASWPSGELYAEAAARTSWRTCCAGPRNTASPTCSWPVWAAPEQMAARRRSTASPRFTSWWTPAPPSSRPTPLLLLHL